MPDTFKVAIAQMSYDWTRPGSIEENLLKARDFIKKAARATCRVVIFGEYFLGDLPVEPLPNEQIAELRAQAKRSRINIVCGITRNRVSEQPREQYLTSVVIGRRGEILALVNKAVYNPTERPWFDKVSVVEPVEIDGVLCGVMAGYDAAVSNVARLLVEKGAEILLYQLSASSSEERDTIQAAVIARSNSNGVPVAAVGQLGEFMKRQYLGGSIAVMPRTVKYGVMEVADGVDIPLRLEEEEELGIVEFDLRALRAMRKKFSHLDLVPEGLC
ncbi:MAG: carbon-nitrogen hydrolase family protein [Thermoplasmata archaeon]|nr:carbon-nitrogen hydrolase family protein [Thermoplasmata archaeon]